MQVLIAGAGPTGLTAAVELARRGVVPMVIDRREDPSTLSRAVGILPSSLNTLEPSGVTERLLAEGIRVQEMQLFFGKRRALRLSLVGGHPERDYALALAQDHTEAALRDALARYGGTVSYGTQLVGLSQDKDRVVAQTGDGKEAAYDYLIGADGIHSKTRESLGIDFPGHDLPETWSIADVDAIDWPNTKAFTMCILPHGRLAFVAPLEAERFRVVSNTEDSLAALPLEMNVTYIRRQGQFHISIRQVTQYNKGRVFLAGDAAHCHSPAGGRGMNLGIADAAELADRLLNNQLDGYGASRHSEGADTIALSERLRRTVTAKSIFKRAGLRVGCRMVNMIPSIQRRIARYFLSG